MILIDFETRCRTGITAGASRYSLDAEIMCLSYQIGEDGCVKSWRPGEPEPTDLLDAITDGHEVFAHNASFEMAIWRNVMVDQYFWPEIPIKQWRCTMTECYALGLPGSLEKVAETLKLDVKKDMGGRRLMLKMSKPRRPTKHDKSEWHEKPEDVVRLREYCDQDVKSELAVHNAVRRLSNREQAVFHFDALVNFRGVRIDRELAESVVDVWDQYSDRLNNELNELTFGQLETADKIAAIKAFLPEIGAYGIDELSAGKIVEILSDKWEFDLPPTARRIIEIRAELALSSIKKFTKMLECIEPDDRIRGCFQYHGAQQTGRWAGRLVQLQNLPRGEVKSEEIEGLVKLVKTRDLNKIIAESPLPLGKLLSSLARPCIVADEGKRLIVSDFSGVEARGLAWASGEDWLLDAFREGKDIYKEMATSIYGVKYDDVTKDQRFYGKQAILGAGYSMGAAKFKLLLATYGVEATEEFCKMVIDAYRAKNKKIVRFWRTVENAAVRAVESRAPQKAGEFTFHVCGDWLHARLPSGRDISYYKPRLEPGMYGQQITFLGVGINGAAYRNSTYSGKLVENIIQALCRDLLVEAMSNLERAGYTVIAHVHDEVICEVDEDFGSVEEVEQIMSKVPAWADGFPLGAEGFECKRYRK